MRNAMITVLALCALCVLTSVLYMTDVWFTFEFLGEEQGSEANSVHTWAVVNLLAALLLAVLALTQLKGIHRKTVLFMTTLINTILTVHVFPLLLWLVLASGSEQAKGAALHLIVSVMCIIAVWTIRKSLKTSSR